MHTPGIELGTFRIVDEHLPTALRRLEPEWKEASQLKAKDTPAKARWAENGIDFRKRIEGVLQIKVKGNIKAFVVDLYNINLATRYKKVIVGYAVNRLVPDTLLIERKPF